MHAWEIFPACDLSHTQGPGRQDNQLAGVMRRIRSGRSRWLAFICRPS